MSDFHSRAVVADQLQSSYPPPITTREFEGMLRELDDPTGASARLARKVVWWVN